MDTDIMVLVQSCFENYAIHSFNVLKWPPTVCSVSKSTLTYFVTVLLLFGIVFIKITLKYVIIVGFMCRNNPLGN